MDITKYRAFIKDAGIIVDVKRLQLTREGAPYSVELFDSEDPDHSGQTYFYGAGITLLPFTGLYDENGAEIYSGEYLRDDDSPPILHKVVWDKEHAAFKILAWCGGEDWDEYPDEIYWLSRTKEDRLKGFVVIGHELTNPELLVMKPQD